MCAHTLGNFIVFGARQKFDAFAHPLSPSPKSTILAGTCGIVIRMSEKAINNKAMIFSLIALLLFIIAFDIESLLLTIAGFIHCRFHIVNYHSQANTQTNNSKAQKRLIYYIITNKVQACVEKIYFYRLFLKI